MPDRGRASARCDWWVIRRPPGDRDDRYVNQVMRVSAGLRRCASGPSERPDPTASRISAVEGLDSRFSVDCGGRWRDSRLVDEGRRVSYLLLAKATPVYVSDGEAVGKVKNVLCEPAADIFDGLEVATEGGDRYVAAEHVAAIHERGVELSITADELAIAPKPAHDSGKVRWDLSQPPAHLWEEVVDWLLDHPPHGHPARDSRLEHAHERLEARRRALKLAREDPELAVEAGVGRPDLSGADSGGVVDINHAPAEALRMLPGIDRSLAQHMVDMREAIGGFVSLEELGMLLDLPGDLVEQLRDRAVFLPG